MELLIINDHQNPLFMDAFKLYFKELGIKVSDYDNLFKEINQDKETFTFAYVVNNEMIAFIMSKEDVLKNWFFEMKIGFIREFWVREEYRNQGIGNKLLEEVEKYYKGKNIETILLTTDSADAFYLKHQYRLIKSIEAKNEDNVYMKNL